MSNGNDEINKSKMKESPFPKYRVEDRSRRFYHHALHCETPPFKQGIAQPQTGTPLTEASTPATPMDFNFDYRPRNHSYNNLQSINVTDDGYLGDPEEVRSDKRLRRGLIGVSRRLSRSNSNIMSSHFSFCNEIDTPSNSPTNLVSSLERGSYLRRNGSFSPNSEETKRAVRRLSMINKLLWVTIAVALSIGTMYWTYPISEEEKILAEYQRRKQYPRGQTTSGLKGKMVQMAIHHHHHYDSSRSRLKEIESGRSIKINNDINEKQSKKLKRKRSSKRRLPHQLKFTPPPPLAFGQDFNAQDRFMYSEFNPLDNKPNGGSHRIVALGDSNILEAPVHRTIELYKTDFTDNTQLYGLYDSDDERLSRMEIREPLEQGECVPMQKWQTTFHPSCNGVHELGLEYLGSDGGDDFNLFGTKGFWRNAWKVDLMGGHSSLDKRETFVLKTLKFVHNFEDAHFEHDRVDAVAMERLTSSPHVINLFGFCGHSVMTEYADGSRLGELADKSKKKPLARLKIARDIAMGLADVHGIDGDGNATFVHLDINPANVVSIGGTLKLNDFNIGILQTWNTTSNKPCGFPTQYPNPQWRSPEEARNEQNLTEKVDVFSMGHILFRLICGHEPWNKLEIGGRPTKEEVNSKVQKGILPHIPKEVLSTNNKEIQAIRDAMMACYTYNPSERPAARNIALQLQGALEVLTKEHKEEKQRKKKERKDRK